MSIIVIYAPTLDVDDSAKDDFYVNLKSILNKIPTKNLAIIAGEFNARTGLGDKNTERTVDQFAIDDRCSNGN